jgi:hypothetical protein
MADHFDDHPAAQLRREIKDEIHQDLTLPPAAQVAERAAAHGVEAVEADEEECRRPPCLQYHSRQPSTSGTTRRESHAKRAAPIVIGSAATVKQDSASDDTWTNCRRPYFLMSPQ